MSLIDNYKLEARFINLFDTVEISVFMPDNHCFLAITHNSLNRDCVYISQAVQFEFNLIEIDNYIKDIINLYKLAKSIKQIKVNVVNNPELKNFLTASNIVDILVNVDMAKMLVKNYINVGKIICLDNSLFKENDNKLVVLYPIISDKNCYAKIDNNKIIVKSRNNGVNYILKYY